MLMNLFVFFLLFGAFSMLFRLRCKDFLAALKWLPAPSLRQKIHRANSKNRGFFSTQLEEAKEILSIYNIPGGIWLLNTASIGLAITGFGFSSFVKNLFIAPILMVTLAVLPFLSLKIYWLYKEKQMHETLEIALNTITSTYLRSSGSIVSVVEENINILPSPIDQLFRHFLLQVTYVDASIIDALESLKLTVHHEIFHQWVDVLIQAEYNHKTKENLTKILDKFSDAKAIQLETGVILSDAKRTYLSMFFLSLLAPFLIYFINPHWWDIMTTTVGGKICVMIYLLGILVSAVIAYKAYRQSQGGVSL